MFEGVERFLHVDLGHGRSRAANVSEVGAVDNGNEGVRIFGCFRRSPLPVRLDEQLGCNAYLQENIIEKLWQLVSQLSFLLRVGGYRRDSNGIEIGSRKTFHARVIRLGHIVGFEIGHDVRHLIGEDPGHWAVTRTHSGVHCARPSKVVVRPIGLTLVGTQELHHEARGLL